MKVFKTKRKLISILIVSVLILPVFLFLLAPITVLAEESSNNNESWLKGILLVIITFVLNNYIENNYQITDRPITSKVVTNVDNINNKEILGFYVNWLSADANSYESLKDNYKNIDSVAPFWYTLNPDGNIESRYGGHQYELSSLSNNRQIKVIPLINNNQQNNMILIDPETRTKSINNIIALIKKYNYSGINIDFEFIPSWTRGSYTQFIKELSRKMPEDKLLTISVFPKIDVPINLQGAYDYGELAKHVDRIVIMAYDKHWSTGPAGPIAPIDWVEKNIKYALEYIPAEKILLGIANYGYDWPETGIAKDLSTKKAYNLVENKKASINWHKTSQTPYFYYWDNDGNKHEVWFENSYSTSFKLDLVEKYNLKGIAIWRLGNGTEDFWEIIKEKLS